MADLVDIHTHLLPDLDDGPTSMEQSLQLAKKFVESGTHFVFATPHGFSPYYHTDVSAIQQAMNAFRQFLQEELLPLEIAMGMEVRYHQDLFSKLEDGSALCLGGKQAGERFLLLELPTRDWPMHFTDVIYELKIREITPIIAHPERNMIAQQDPHVVEEVVEEGAWVQLTAGACTGEFGPLCQKAAKRFTSEGWVHLVASDAHDAIHRAPGLSNAYNIIAHEWRLPTMVSTLQQNALDVWQMSTNWRR